MKTRRSFLQKAGALLATFGVGTVNAQAHAGTESKEKRVMGTVVHSEDVPLFASAVAYGNLLFIAGKGAHFEGDIKAHTDHVLNEIQKELEKAGSSMNKVLKVNVYLRDIKDYQAMNEVYRGRFGEKPPVRTTVACFGGVPGDSLVEIDCIAALD